MMQLIPQPDHFSLDLPKPHPTYPKELQQVLNKFPKVFSLPTTLPPTRATFDHQIPLKEGTNAINIRPYRYPLL